MFPSIPVAVKTNERAFANQITNVQVSDDVWYYCWKSRGWHRFNADDCMGLIARCSRSAPFMDHKITKKTRMLSVDRKTRCTSWRPTGISTISHARGTERAPPPTVVQKVPNNTRDRFENLESKAMAVDIHRAKRELWLLSSYLWRFCESPGNTHRAVVRDF